MEKVRRLNITGFIAMRPKVILYKKKAQFVAQVKNNKILKLIKFQQSKKKIDIKYCKMNNNLYKKNQKKN